MPAKHVEGASLSLRSVPDEWLLEHGYAERYTYHAAYRDAEGHWQSEERVRPAHRESERDCMVPGLGVSEEVVLFHYFYGMPPRRRYHSGVAAAQWSYKPLRKAADRDALAQALARPAAEMEVAA